MNNVSDLFRRRRYREVRIALEDAEHTFRIQSLTQREFQTLLAPLIDPDTGRIDPREQAAFDARLIQACVVGEDGKLLFSEADIPAIQEWDSAVTTRLSRAIQEHIGMQASEKNSPKTRSG